MKKHYAVCQAVFFLALSPLIVPFTAAAQNQVLGEVQLAGKTKADKTSAVWGEGQYVGCVAELKAENKITRLPGEHEIPVCPPASTDLRQKVVVERHKKRVR